MVMMNMGIAFLPQLFVISELKQEARLSVLNLKDETIARNHVAAWRLNSPSRPTFQLSYELKAIAMENFTGVLAEVVTEENI